MPQVECDGISLNLYATLAKETRRMHCARVFIPSTVIFDHGFASAWYFSTQSMEVKRRHDKEISAQDIFKEFSRSHAPNADIVAVFMTATRPALYVDRLESVVTVAQYMNKADLHQFLFSGGEKPRGMLQKYVYPKGTSATSVQVSWSPKLTIVQAVRNPYSLYDKTRSVGMRGGTNEIAVNTQIATTNSVTIAVKQLSELVNSHIATVEHTEMSGMVLNFKVDHESRVVLLYSTSLRVGKSASGIMSSDTHVPLNLLHKFVLREAYDMEQELDAYWTAKKATHARLKQQQVDELKRQREEQQQQQLAEEGDSFYNQEEEAQRMLNLSGAQNVESTILHSSSMSTLPHTRSGSTLQQQKKKRSLPPLARHPSTATYCSPQQPRRESETDTEGSPLMLVSPTSPHSNDNSSFAGSPLSSSSGAKGAFEQRRAEKKQQQQQDTHAAATAYQATYELLRRAGTMGDAKKSFAHLKKVSSYLSPAHHALGQTPNVRHAGKGNKWVVTNTEAPIIPTTVSPHGGGVCEDSDKKEASASVEHTTQATDTTRTNDTKEEEQESTSPSKKAKKERPGGGNDVSTSSRTTDEDIGLDRQQQQQRAATTARRASKAPEDEATRAQRKRDAAAAAELLEDILYSIHREYLEANRKVIRHRFCLRVPALHHLISVEYLMHVMRELTPRVVTCTNGDTDGGGEEDAEWFTSMRQRIKRYQQQQEEAKEKKKESGGQGAAFANMDSASVLVRTLDDLEERIFPPLSEDSSSGQTLAQLYYEKSDESDSQPNEGLPQDQEATETAEASENCSFVWIEVRSTGSDLPKHLSYVRNRIKCTTSKSYVQAHYYDSANRNKNRKRNSLEGKKSWKKKVEVSSPQVKRDETGSVQYPALSLILDESHTSTSYPHLLALLHSSV